MIKTHVEWDRGSTLHAIGAVFPLNGFSGALNGLADALGRDRLNLELAPETFHKSSGQTSSRVVRVAQPIFLPDSDRIRGTGRHSKFIPWDLSVPEERQLPGRTSDASLAKNRFGAFERFLVDRIPNSWFWLKILPDIAVDGAGISFVEAAAPLPSAESSNFQRSKN